MVLLIILLSGDTYHLTTHGLLSRKLFIDYISKLVMAFFGFTKKRQTYKLVKEGRAVYIGSTSNPYKRNAEHSRSNKDYDYMEITSGKLSKTEAERREARNLGSYRSATGKRPKYNKTDNG